MAIAGPGRARARTLSESRDHVDQGLCAALLISAPHRLVMFGIFSIFSCVNPLRWTNIDFDQEAYFQPTTRLGLAIKTLDRKGFPSDGRVAFSCFDWIDAAEKHEAAMRATPLESMFIPKRECQWNWSDFFAATIQEWDLETGRFLNNMRDRHGLPTRPIPFAVHRSGLEYTEQTFRRFQAALGAAEPYIADDRRFFVTSEGYRRHFSDVYDEQRGDAAADTGT
jgi:hypothetical protein